MLYVVDVNCDIKIIHRYGNTLRFPWAAVEPPCASHYVVSPMPFFPQESPCISYASMVFVKTLCYLILLSVMVVCSGGPLTPAGKANALRWDER